MDDYLKPMGRLTFREEGENWNCYYALADTMKGALYFSSIKMAFVRKSPKVKQMFMDTMRECFDVMMEDIIGQRATWREPVAAPEDERTKE